MKLGDLGFIMDRVVLLIMGSFAVQASNMWKNKLGVMAKPLKIIGIFIIVISVWMIVSRLIKGR